MKMSCKRVRPSWDLLPYLKLSRGIDEPKYDFSASRIMKRKRKLPTSSTCNRKLKGSSAESDDIFSMKTANSTMFNHSITSESNSFAREDEHSQIHVPITLSEADETLHSSVQYGCAHPYEQIPLDGIQRYSLLLLENNAISLCNYCSSAFVLQDLNEETRKLKPSYVFVERRSIQFSDALKLVYWCSCDPQSASFVSTLSAHISLSSAEFKPPECIHIGACKSIVEDHDREIGVTPENVFYDPICPFATSTGDCVFPLHDGTTVCIYDWTRDYGVVTHFMGGLVCVTCKRSKECKHVSLVLSWKERDYPSSLDAIFACLDSTSQSPALPRLLGVSKNRVTFKPNKSQQQILQRGGIQNCIELTEGKLPLKCTVDSPRCSLCSSVWSFQDQSMYLVTETTTVLAQVTTTKCLGCSMILDYDGAEDAVVNMGVCLVSHDLLRTYLHLFLNGRFPMYSFHKALVGKHRDSGDKQFVALFPYYMFRAAWYKFVALLDIDFKSGFACPKCSTQPDIVICDATSLAFRRQLLKLSHHADDTDEILDGSLFKDRVFINDATCRGLLYRYSRTAEDDDVMLSFSEREVKEMVDLLQVYSPTLVPLIQSWNALIPCNSTYSPLLKALSCPSPVCALIPLSADVLELVDKLAEGCEVRSAPDLWLRTQERMPIFQQLLIDLNTNSMPAIVRPTILEMRRIAVETFEKTSPEIDRGPAELHGDTAYYPNLPRVRARRTYRCDSRRTQQPCNKVHRGHPSLLPGIFTLFCCHGICIGFEVMESHESPNVPFSTFKTRFKEAPSVIVYDNACSLHAYCLNRDPHFFKFTSFFVDRFHWKNHTGCSEAYHMDKYPQLTYINSEVNEQANASLSKLKPQLSYMNQDNFMTHCKLYLWYRNCLKLNNLFATDVL